MKSPIRIVAIAFSAFAIGCSANGAMAPDGTATPSLTPSVATSQTVSRVAPQYGKNALWQIGLSFNCNNPAFCGADATGGFWGWVEFDRGGQGNATLTGCGHLVGG